MRLCWGLSGEFGRGKREYPQETRGHLNSPFSLIIVSNSYHFHVLNTTHFCPLFPECICSSIGYHFKPSDAGFPATSFILFCPVNCCQISSFYSASLIIPHHYLRPSRDAQCSDGSCYPILYQQSQDLSSSLSALGFREPWAPYAGS